MNFLNSSGVTKLTSYLRTKFAGLVNGAVAINQGGTGATTASDARANLGTPSINDVENVESSIASIKSSIAFVESSTAINNHAIGDYFMLGNVLMKATSAIAAGESITVNNATPVTVQSQLNALRNSMSSSGLVRVLVDAGTVTVPTSGYYSIQSILPTGTQFVTVQTWSSVTNNGFFTINQNYVCAAPNTTISGLKVNAWVRP